MLMVRGFVWRDGAGSMRRWWPMDPSCRELPLHDLVEFESVDVGPDLHPQRQVVRELKGEPLVRHRTIEQLLDVRCARRR
jgi:hypothetical protein